MASVRELYRKRPSGTIRGGPERPAASWLARPPMQESGDLAWRAASGAGDSGLRAGRAPACLENAHAPWRGAARARGASADAPLI